jgi:c-di-GMP-binding flagellar brake protein YcgR
VSLGGAAIEVEADAEVPSTRIALELRPVGVALQPVTIDAGVRHARRLESGAWHVGLEFTDLSPADRTALDRIIRRFAT